MKQFVNALRYIVIPKYSDTVYLIPCKLALPAPPTTKTWETVGIDMPTKFTERMIAAAIAGFEAQKREIDVEIAALRAIGKESGPATPEPVSDSRKPARRKMSAASRKKMALAQQKRWAAKKETVPEPEVVVEGPVAAKPKRKLSAAGKKRIIEASKKYWAAKRAAAKKAE
jgi:hypothetical protein